MEENLDLASSSIPESVSQNSDGSFTASPAAGVQEIVLRDKAGNETSVHITVNGTHTFEDGVCVHCGASDPDYVPEPTEDTNIPDITLTALNEDGTAADGQGTDGWYRTKYITLTAPEGYNIVENPYARLRRMPTLDIELEEGENEIEYYLIKEDNTTISELRTRKLYLEKVVKKLGSSIPILGVCLGHQSICEAFGGVVSYAKELKHGKQDEMIRTCDSVLLNGLPERFQAARYHSLAAREETLPKKLIVTAKSEDGEIMAVEHKDYPVYGVQFHPESVMTPDGKKMIENFLKGAEK